MIIFQIPLIQTVGGGLIAMIGTSMLSAALPYEPGLNIKHLAWIGEYVTYLFNFQVDSDFLNFSS